jgi:hypothetical protein
LIPRLFDGIPAPLRIVFTTVFVVGPAALELVFPAAVADGSIATRIARVAAIRDLLAFIVHREFLCGDLSVNL